MNPLEDILRGKTSIRVVKTLLRFPAKSFTGRELALAASVQPSDAIDVMRRLLDHGLVGRRTVGRAHQWDLNTKHFLVGPLQSLVKVDDALAALEAIVTSTLKAARDVEKVVLFGSVARGEERPNSDVDLLVIVASQGAKRHLLPLMARLRLRLEATFTNPLAEIIYSRAEYARKRHLPAVRNAEREGIVLWERPREGVVHTKGKGRNLSGKG